jgi:predicted CXXCH cytochrome family protein
VLIAGCASKEPSPGPASLDTLAFVGRDVCAECHQDAALSWAGSDHDRAMEVAAPEVVLGNFSDASFMHCGVETQFFRDGDAFFIRTQSRDGAMETFPVAYTFGYRPLQQYLIPLEGGRMQAFTIAWDSEREQWFSLAPEECAEPADWLHWTGEAMNWNYMCADCHSTNLQRNFDLAADRYATTFSEVDVSCEACHGPGEAHVARARAGRYDASSPGLPARLTAPHRQVDTCAPCHSRRRIIHPDYVAGRPFLDHYEPELLDEDLYFSDGQIRDEVYVYGSFLQSRMYASGVACTDCHDPHSTLLKLEGNALCGQCHEPAVYDTFEHVRHPDGSEGSQCVDCHMPERTYMVVDPRRDHSFKVPRPDLTAELGTPNACSGCHEDRSAAWAAERIADWHGPERPSSFARALAGGREGRPDAEGDLLALAQDAAAPGIARATALSLLDRYPTVRASNAAFDLLQDSSALVRMTAVRNLSAESDRAAAGRIEALLTDSVRLVRSEAARVLTMIAPGRYVRDAEGDAAYWSALEEYREGQLGLSDQAAAHLNLGVIHEQLGALSAAAEAYETALRIDSSFVPAHLNVAMLYEQMRGEGDSERLAASTEAALRRAVQLRPDLAEAHYTLGLLLAESPERLEEAAVHLSTAAELDTANARMQYNAGLAHQRLGNADAAEPLLLRALRLEPDHPDYLNGLSIFYAQQEAWETALTYTGRLLQHVPNNPDFQQRATYLREQMNR